MIYFVKCDASFRPPWKYSSLTQQSRIPFPKGHCIGVRMKYSSFDRKDLYALLLLTVCCHETSGVTIIFGPPGKHLPR